MVVYMHTAPRSLDRAVFTKALSAAGMNVPTLARAIPTNERYIRAVSAGLVPGPGMRQLIARALGVAVDELFVPDPLPQPTAAEKAASTR